MNPNPKAFLGKGWSFPIRLENDETGEKTMPIATYEKSVEESIKLILETRQGERVMNPEFGSGLWSMVFEPSLGATESEVTRIVQEALTKWEPRITIDDITTTVNPDKAERLDISISYTINRTNNSFNLVYPFYLERQ